MCRVTRNVCSKSTRNLKLCNYHQRIPIRTSNRVQKKVHQDSHPLLRQTQTVRDMIILLLFKVVEKKKRFPLWQGKPLRFPSLPWPLRLVRPPTYQWHRTSRWGLSRSWRLRWRSFQPRERHPQPRFPASTRSWPPPLGSPLGTVLQR